MRTPAWLLPVALALLCAACDKPASRTAAGPASEKLPPADAMFSDARSRIVSGEYAEGAALMRKLTARKDLPAEIEDWVLIFGGLAELLVNHEEESRPLFARLAERNAPEKAPGKLAKFFSDVGVRMSGDKPVDSKVASGYDRVNHEAIALYLHGLKDESLGAREDALTFYRQFVTATASGPDLWMGFNNQLKKLRQSATDFCEYEELVDAATRERKSGSGLEAVARAVESAAKVREKIKRESKLIADLDAQLGDKTRTMAAEDDADVAVFPAAKESWKALMAKYEFAEAKRVIFEARLKTDKRQKEQDLLAAKAGYLEQFKFYLVLEMGATGYAKPVSLKSGSEIPTGIAKLDDQRIYVRDKETTVPIPWSELAPQSVYEMAKSLMSPSEDANKAAFRKWHLGNFAAFIGKMDEARTLMNEAAAANPQYAPEVATMLGESGSR